MFPLRDLLAQLSEQLDAANIDTPLLDARLLVGLAMGLDRQVYPHEDFALNADMMARLDKLTARRMMGEPISRIRGWREFWSMRFNLSRACLDPRPDSETLVSAALEFRENMESSPLIMDYGTGSGCLLLAVLSEWPEARGTGLDFNSDAIATAAANADYHGLSDRAQFMVSDWCTEIDEDIKADIILANPPYIPTAELPRLEREVRDYDPYLALDGGEDGLDAWQAIIPKIAYRLSSQGTALVEIGMGQESAVIELAMQYGLILCGQWHDISGILRVLGLTKIK